MSLRSTGTTAAAGADVPPQALRATVAPTARNALRLSPYMYRFSSLNRYFAADAIGSPLDEPVFERADEPLRNEGEDGQQEHAREHSVDVEGMACAIDELAEARRRPEQFPDHGADYGQAKADVEAGENPGECGRDDDLGRQAAVVGAEDARVRNQVAVHLAHALEGIEEDDEEHEHHGRPRFAPHRQTEHDREERAENNTPDGTRALDEERKGFSEQLDAAQQDTQDDAEPRADEA